MYPQMTSAFFGLLDTVQMQVINKTVVDFDVNETVLDVVTFDAVLQVMKPEDVNRKPEGLRQWKFYDMWTDFNLKLDTPVQGPDGTQFRVQDVEPWELAGFFKYSLVQQPYNLGVTP